MELNWVACGSHFCVCGELGLDDRHGSIVLRVQDTTGKGKQVGDGLRIRPKDDANECDDA